MSIWLFYAFAVIAIAGALAMVLNVRNTVAGALSLVATMIALGGIYVLLEAYLIGAFQILIYAGAIVVLFLFVVMLLNLRREEYAPARGRVGAGIGIAAGALVLAWFLSILPESLPGMAAISEDFGGYRHVGLALFRDYVLAFEVTSLLLLGAMVGAVILAKRRI